MNAGGVGGGLLNQDDDDSRSGASAAEVCVVWLNRAQNTSVTTLCKSPLWMCQEVRIRVYVIAASDDFCTNYQ